MNWTGVCAIQSAKTSDERDWMGCRLGPRTSTPPCAQFSSLLEAIGSSEVLGLQ
jgi:hypothetical protein